MKDVCTETGITYETLKFYCNQGLVPNHKRDKNNHRIFTDKDIAWIKGLLHLKQCGMSIKEMKTYMLLCMEGPSSIVQRKAMLTTTYNRLLIEIKQIQDALQYINSKQQYYDDLLAERIPYSSNLD